MAQGARTGAKAQADRGGSEPALLPAEALWALWRRIVRVLPLAMMPIDSMFAPSAWTLAGVDYVSGLRRNRSTACIIALLAPLSPADLRRIHLLAQLNHRRHEVVSRWMAIGFVTLPLSGALALSELAPDLLRRIQTEWLDLSLTSLLAVGGVVAFYLAAAWRARQVASVIELAIIERGALLDAGAGEADAEPPQLLES
jgi:hypothetical protein